MTRGQKTKLKKYMEGNRQDAAEGPGRISKLSWEMLEHIEVLLNEGQFQKYVFDSMNIPKTTWDAWVHKGRELLQSIQDKKKVFEKLKVIEQKYLWLGYLVNTGKAKAIIKHQNIIAEAGKKDWKASAWFLEMQDRELYGKKLETDLNIKNTDIQNMHDAYDEMMKNAKSDK